MAPSNERLQKKRSTQNDAGSQTVVGFEDDAGRLVEKLMGGKKKLQFISVVGMAGLGKTTLVRKVFDEPSVVYHFHVRAWTTVTQEPRKRDLLLGILKSGFNAGIDNCSDMDLSVTLKRRLSGQRYLVVMDDIWDSKDWSDLMLCFPDDNVGSRIVFTTRLADVPLQVQPDCYQHPLRFLNEKESWDLLQYKVFLNDSCPSSLVEIGKQIAKKCHGLPLSVVVIAGILANDTTTHWWSRVGQDMNSIGSTAPEQYMDTLVLSYNHLPDHLKPCFLYFAAFPEDYEMPVWKLILLWVAEGFIEIQTKNKSKEGGNNLEEVAAQYLNDLITRSLVIVSKSSSKGGIKSCTVHDALHDLCMTKANEVNFLHQIPSFYKDKETYQHFVSKLQIPPTNLVQRLYSREVDGENFIRQLIRYFHLETPAIPLKGIYRLSFILPRAFKRIKYIFRKSLNQNIQTILAYNRSGTSFVKVRHTPYHLFNALRVFNFLAVMDMSSIGISSIPEVIESLLQLRYIAVCIKADNDDSVDKSISSPRWKPTITWEPATSTSVRKFLQNLNPSMSTSIRKLKHLETFIVHCEKVDGTFLPDGILELDRLRHVIVKGIFFNRYRLHGRKIHPDLELLPTPISLEDWEKFLEVTPNLWDMKTLPNFKTLTLPISLDNCKKILEVTPNLQKLDINHDLYLSSTTLMIANLAKLQHLESLSLQNKLGSDTSADKLLYRELSSGDMFPVTLKKLTLICTCLKWDEMQKIGMLPNLEVLKLQCEAFRGEHWETNDGGFRQLKHLSFKFMRMVHWSAFSEQFPSLQHLKLDECEKLQEIPISIGDIYTLEMIEVRNCHLAAVQSARRIKKDQMNKGNDSLKVSIFQG